MEEGKPMIWVLMDLGFLAHRARCTTRGLEWQGKPTGVIYGFFETLRTICFDSRIQSNKVAIFCDSKQSFRREAFPEYKQKRHQNKTPEEIAELKIMKEQVARLKDDILPDIGFPVYRQSGLESDDLMAAAALWMTLNNLFHSKFGNRAAVMVTADGDLYQSITWAVHWYDPIRNLYLDPMSFLHFKGVDHSQWSHVKALAGCHSDNVPGIPGIGEKSAIDYLTDVLPREHRRHKLIETNEGRAIRDRNLRLVALPHPKTKAMAFEEPKYSAAKFYAWCKTLGIASYSDSKKRQWDAFFDGQMTSGVQVPRKRGESRHV